MNTVHASQNQILISFVSNSKSRCHYQRNFTHNIGLDQIRDNHRVCNMAVHVVCGVNLEGKREVLAVKPMYEESEASYTALFTGLKKRGLKSVWLAVSDAHQGLVSAIKKSFVGCSWQRCKVHFMRNILGSL